MMDLSLTALHVQRTGVAKAYFEVLEQACGEIESRFNNLIYLDIESLLVNAANGQDIPEYLNSSPSTGSILHGLRPSC